MTDIFLNDKDRPNFVRRNKKEVALSDNFMSANRRLMTDFTNAQLMSSVSNMSQSDALHDEIGV